MACGIWEPHQMSELAPVRRAQVCASAFCLYTYDYEVVGVYNGELCAHLMLHNPIFVICARDPSKVFHHHCHNINKTTWFLKNVENHTWSENTKHFFHRSKLFLICNVWYCNLKFIFATAWHKNRNFCCWNNKLSIKMRGNGKL